MGTQFDPLQVRQLELCAKPRRLPLHIVNQLRPLNAVGPARKILDKRSNAELPAGFVSFENQRFQVGASAVDRRCQSGASGAENYGVTSLYHEVSQLIVEDRDRGYERDKKTNDFRPVIATPASPIPLLPRSLYKMFHMANLTLVYGMRLLPEGEVKEIQDATLKLVNGHEAHVTMHVIEGSRKQIEAQLKQSLDAFFDFYPEI